MLEFLKLEKIEFGGKLGGTFNEMVGHIFSEFVDLQNKFNNSTYDPLDIDTVVSKLCIVIIPYCVHTQASYTVICWFVCLSLFTV